MTEAIYLQVIAALYDKDFLDSKEFGELMERKDEIVTSIDNKNYEYILSSNEEE